MPTYEKPQPTKQIDTAAFPRGSTIRLASIPDRRWEPGEGQTEEDRPLAILVELELRGADGEQVAYGTAYLSEVAGSPNAIENALPNVVESILKAEGFTQA